MKQHGECWTSLSSQFRKTQAVKYLIQVSIADSSYAHYGAGIALPHVRATRPTRAHSDLFSQCGSPSTTTPSANDP